MNTIKNRIAIAALCFLLGAAFTLPAGGVVPTNTSYITLPLWGGINDPFGLTWVGTACIEFSQSTVNWTGVYSDRGPYEIVLQEGSLTFIEGEVNPNIGILFQGKLDIHGVVDRKGPGSSFSWVGSGKLRSLLGAIPPTRTNVAGMAIQDTFGFCSAGTATRSGNAAANWVVLD